MTPPPAVDPSGDDAAPRRGRRLSEERTEHILGTVLDVLQDVGYDPRRAPDLVAAPPDLAVRPAAGPPILIYRAAVCARPIDPDPIAARLPAPLFPPPPAAPAAGPTTKPRKARR